MEDNKFVELIEENYAAIREKYSDLKDDRLKWELIKMEIRRLTISYSKHKEKQRRIRETELQKRFEALEIKINNCNTDEQLSAEIEEYDNLKIELQRIYASVNSSCAHPPPGQLRGSCTPCHSRGWGISKFGTARGVGHLPTPGLPPGF